MGIYNARDIVETLAKLDQYAEGNPFVTGLERENMWAALSPLLTDTYAANDARWLCYYLKGEEIPFSLQYNYPKNSGCLYALQYDRGNSKWTAHRFSFSAQLNRHVTEECDVMDVLMRLDDNETEGADRIVVKVLLG